MKRDIIRKRKFRQTPFEVSSAYVRQHLVGLLRLTEELRVGYETYPRLQAVVDREAWEQLTDVPYRQLLDLNLHPRDRALRDAAAKNILRLEDLAASLLVRDRSGLNDSVTRVLRYRIENGLATADAATREDRG